VHYEIADELDKATRFCATLARAKTAEFMNRGFVPRHSDLTATVSFVGLGDRTYAVTAYHVVSAFKELALEDGIDGENYFIPTKPGRILHAPFVRPVPRLPFRDPDVAMMPIPRDLPALIGKEIYQLRDEGMPRSIRVALAAGFPTAAKRPTGNDPYAAIELPGVSLLAEGVESDVDSDQMQFYSEVRDNFGNRLTYDGDISGMSGGPVFWSDRERHGLLGFVKQSMADGSQSDGRRERVSLICQRTSYETFALWADYVDREYPRRRQQLNRKAPNT